MGLEIDGWGEEEWGLVTWARREGLWDGRVVEVEESGEFRGEIAAKIFRQMPAGGVGTPKNQWPISLEEERMGKLQVPELSPRVESWEEPPMSQKFVVRGKEKEGVRIGFINGMSNDLAGARESAELVSSLAQGHQVELVYNKSHGCWDVAEAILNYLGFSPVTQDLLVENWTRFDREYADNPNAKYIQVCHSQGAIHVKNALNRLPPEIRNRVEVILVAPAAMVSEEDCRGANHFSSVLDPIPRVEVCLRVLKDANYLHFSDDTRKVVKAYREVQWLEQDLKDGVGHQLNTPVLVTRLEQVLNDKIK